MCNVALSTLPECHRVTLNPYKNVRILKKQFRLIFSVRKGPPKGKLCILWFEYIGQISFYLLLRIGKVKTFSPAKHGRQIRFNFME